MNHGEAPRHLPGHKFRKKAYNSDLRRITKVAIRNNEEPPTKLAGFMAPGFCCGYHTSDWRY